MNLTDRIKKNILSAAVLVALLFVFGTAAYANVTARPTAVSFGNQTVGTAGAPVEVILTNTGRERVKIVNASLSTTQFSYSGPSLPITLNRGQRLTAYVTFDPSAAQAYSGTLIFKCGTDSSISVSLSGAGVQTQATPLLPTITTQPASQTVTAGQTAAFSVAVTGTAPFTYQWNNNGAAISGATSSSYTTPATTTSNNGAQFTAVVTNSAGSATSTAATLTVNAATPILNASSTSLSFGSVTVSSSSAQNVTLTNAGNTNVTISSVSVSGAGFNASGISTGLILTPGQTATLSATFTPAATGSVTGSVTVTSNASNSPDTIALSGTGVAQVNHSVSLSWTASTSVVTGYNSYSSTTSGGPYTKLTTTPVAATTYADTAVQAGQTYYYVVTSVNSSGVESGYSNEISAIVP
jgi:hypothetical protein